MRIVLLLIVALTGGRLVFEAYRRHRTVYIVTSCRAIRVRALWRVSVKSTWFDKLTGTRLEVAPDGSGTISFEIPPPSNIAIDDATAMLMKRPPDPTFDNIDHVASVNELIVRVWEGLQPTA